MKRAARLLTGLFVASFCHAGCQRAGKPPVPSRGAPQQRDASQLVVGSARFTVITPTLIRMEYAADRRFVDAPSYFAVQRAPRFRAATITNDGRTATIDTGALELRYEADGQPFGPNNLTAKVRGRERFSPASPKTENLGGASRTLDFWKGAGKLDDGILTRAGWYVLDDSRGPLLEHGWIQERESSARDWYLFGYGHDYRAALSSLTAVAGPVPMPRKYALGVWYSRYWRYSAAELQTIAKEYAEHDFPLDVMVLDMDWHRAGWTGWSWNHELIPEPEQLLRAFHDSGLATTLNLHPADGVGPHEDAYPAFMRALGQEPATRATLPFDAADERYMKALFATVLAPLTQQGVDFYWLDWQQAPFTRSAPTLANLPWLNELFLRASRRADARGLSFSRWGGFGDHRHPIHFSGDAATSFEMLAFEVPFTATSSNSGLFFWTHDIGGHVGPRDEEAYARWCQFGALSAALRSHSSRAADLDRRPWAYAAWAEASMKTSFQLRARLFPYIYSSVWQATQSSWPLIRAPYLDEPDAAEAYRQPQQYALGDTLLVAPVSERGAGPKRLGRQVVWFPKGVFYNFFTGERFEGQQPHEQLVAATIDELPLYVRAGVPLPMQPVTRHIAKTPLTELVVRCYPGSDGQQSSFILHEDDGETMAYSRGQFASTPLRCTRSGATITVQVDATQGSFRGQPSERAYVVELPATQRASAIRVDGELAESSSEYADAAAINRVRIAARPISRAVSVQITAEPVPDDELRRRAFASRTGQQPSGPFAALLKRAWSAATSDDERLAVLAAAGSGSFAKNENLYGFPNLAHFVEYRQPWAQAEVQVTTLRPGTDQEAEEATLRYAGRSIVRRTPRRAPAQPAAPE